MHISKYHVAIVVAFLLASLCVWLSEPEWFRQPPAPFATAPTSSPLPQAPHWLTDRQRTAIERSDESATLAAAASTEDDPGARSLERCELELEAVLAHLQRLGELQDLKGVGLAIEEFLQRWGHVEGFGDALQEWLWAGDLAERSARRHALALIARCWLASALSQGIYPVADAQRFAIELVQRAAGAGSDQAAEMLRRVLAQPGESAAPQLVGMPQFGSTLLAHLAESTTVRSALLDLLEDWAAREPMAIALLKGLVEDPHADVRSAAYRALLRSDITNLNAIRDALRAEEADVLRGMAAWLVQRPDGNGFDAFRDLFVGFEASRLGEIHVSSLARDFALMRASAEPAAFDAAWSSARDESSPLGEELRQGLLQGLGLGTPTREQVDLLFASSFDPALRLSALQALAIVSPESAAMRIRELAIDTRVDERLGAILTCGNLLMQERVAPELLRDLAALLEDTRLPLTARDRLAEELAPHLPDPIAAWRRRRGG